MKERPGDWFVTFTGLEVWPMDPRPEDVCIEDIAHSLACQCRFAGHASRFYSVAEHSLNVCRLMQAHPHASVLLQLAALLHDSAEAYLQDVIRPIKRCMANSEEYKQLENRWLFAIAMAVAKHCAVELAELCAGSNVKAMDNIMLVTERRDLFKLTAQNTSWIEDEMGIEPAGFRVECFAPALAENLFLTRFYKLKGR